MKVKIGEARKLGENAERETGTIFVKLEREGQRREVWETKEELRGRKENVEDLT